MNVKVLYFGSLTDITNKDSEQITAKSVNELKKVLEESYPSITTQKFSVSVNHEIHHENVALSENDEVALLPPFAGG